MKEIKLHSGESVFVDDEDFEELSKFKWYKIVCRNTTYATRAEDKKTIIMHRVILNLTDKKVLTDHIDGNGLNNQKSNIRPSTNSQNGANRKAKDGKQSKYLGVHKHGNRFYVVSKKDGVFHNGGSFVDETEAAKAYNELAQRLHGKYARLNVT